EAVRLDAANLQAWALLGDVARATGQSDLEARAWRGYILQRPEADRAQWRLIEALSESDQTVKQKRRVYERLIDRSQTLGPALRSRLAYRAATFWRESGDLKRFHIRLKEAMALDETNFAAFAEAEHQIRSTSSPRERLGALLAMAHAHPGSARVRVEVADLLLDLGLYRESAQWFASADRLWSDSEASGPKQVIRLTERWAMALWGMGKKQSALDLATSVRWRQTDKAKRAPVRPVSLQLIAMAIQRQAGLKDKAAESFDALKRQWEGPEAGPAAKADLIWASLLFQMQVDSAVALLEKKPPADPVLRDRLLGWAALRTGRKERAVALLSRRAGQDLACALGWALSGDGEAPSLSEIHARAPGSLLGLIALSRIDEPKPPGPAAQAAAEWIRRADEQLRRHDGRWVRMEAQVPRRISYGQPLELTGMMVNTTPMPIGLGPGGPVGTDLLIVPRLEVAGQKPMNLNTLMVRFARKIRLEPNEKLVRRLRVGLGEVGAVLVSWPQKPVTLKFKVLLNPQLLPDGTYRVGPGGQLAEAGPVERAGGAISDQHLRRELAKLDRSDSLAALALIGRLFRATAETEEDSPRTGRFVEALGKTWSRMGPLERAWLVTAIPPTGKAQERYRSLLMKAARDPDWQVGLSVLVTHVKKSDCDYLRALEARPDPRIRSLAGRIRRSIEAEAGKRNSKSQKKSAPK
ncbi:MAG: hypothetical protein R3236_06275, partial [Phycisphaeraceae bacterium]|nr:hypothetical protein [Phycisphaeraceae bacterium]